MEMYLRLRVWLTAALLGASMLSLVGAQQAAPDPLAARVDAYVDKPRVVVMTDIANEPDDQMSMVRFLVYSNQFDIEGLIATTSTWMKNKVRPDVIHTLIDAVRAGAAEPAAPSAGLSVGRIATSGGRLRSAVVRHGGRGTGQGVAGADLIIRAAEKPDARPLWVLAWGGTNTLAQALPQAQATKPAAELDALVAKLRVYTISDQDDAGPWIRREFPALHYIALPSTPDGDQYAYATWTGISGDRFYKNAPGADFTTFTDAWVNANIRSKGPLGKLYPIPCCIHEGDTPSFLGLINNGLASFMSPTYGGWGGRYVWRAFYGEPRALWTQGGDSFPGRDNSKDTVTGVDGRTYTSDQATIWRWRTAFQHDFAARMDWTIKDPRAGEPQSRGRRERRRREGAGAHRRDGRRAADARRQRHARSRRPGARRTAGSSMPRPAPVFQVSRCLPAVSRRSAVAAHPARAAFHPARRAVRASRRRV